MGPEKPIFTTAAGEAITGERRPEDIDQRLNEAVAEDFRIAQELNQAIEHPKTNPAPEKK